AVAASIALAAMRCLRISNSSGGCLVSTCSGKPRRVEAAHRSAQMGRIGMRRRVGLLARGSWLSAAFPGLAPQWPSGLELPTYSCATAPDLHRLPVTRAAIDLAVKGTPHQPPPVRRGEERMPRRGAA